MNQWKMQKKSCNDCGKDILVLFNFDGKTVLIIGPKAHSRQPKKRIKCLYCLEKGLTNST